MSPPIEPKPAPGPADNLPDVQPPSSTFVLQLFLIPLVIVSLIVAVWLMFNWLAHAGTDPKDLVRSLRKGDEKGWQDAATLAQLLREREELKSDGELAHSLAEILRDSLEKGQPGDANTKVREQNVKLRMFLCHALGEFKSPEVLPVLLLAANQEHQADDIDVRLRAIEALAIHIQTVGGTRERAKSPPSAELVELRANPDLFDTLNKASRERDEGGAADRTALRTVAAFTLGVLGGEESLNRLAQMLDDSDVNVRYNAATGLSRHGDERAIPVLIEMLNPANESAVANEAVKRRDAKRVLVLINGVQATKLLLDRNAHSDATQLTAALTKLAKSNAAGMATTKAKELLTELDQRKSPPSPEK